MTRYYRLSAPTETEARLLNPQRMSRAWVGEFTRQCADCRGQGVIWLGGYNGEPDRCETCKGDGRVEDERRGVSCCRDLETLARYLVERHATLWGLVVTIEGEESDEEDHDAEAGAVLVIPTAVVAMVPYAESELASLVAQLAES